MAQKSFSAAVSAWVAKVKERRQDVFQEAAQDVVEAMQEPVAEGGNMPTKTGFLRSSLMAGLGQTNFTLRANPDPKGVYSYEGSAVALVIAEAAETGQRVEAVYTANYGKVANYGGENRPARHFVDLAAQRWPQLVEAACERVKQRSGG